MKRKVLIIKAVISVLFFYVLFASTREGALFARIADVNLFYFTLSFLLVPIMIPSSCLKWQVLLAQHHRGLKFLSLLRVYLVGYFFSNLLPSQVGGDVVRSYYIGKRIDSQSDAAVATFIERFTGILLLLVLAVVAPLMHAKLYRSPLIFVPALGAVGLLAFVVWMWKMPKPLRLPDRLARALLGGIRAGARAGRLALLMKGAERLDALYVKVFRQVEQFHAKLLAAVDYLGSNRKPLWSVVGLTFFFYLMTWVNVYVSFKAFGVTPDFFEISALVPTIMVVAMIPVTLLGNLGFTESVYVIFFGLIGVDSAAALSMGLLLRLKLLVVGVIGFLFYLTYRHDKYDVERLEQFAEEMHKEQEPESV